MRISDWSSDVCSSDLLDEARQMLGRTGRREGTRQGEQRHLLALEEFAGLYRLRALVGHHVERAIGAAVANLAGHGFLVWSACERSACIFAAAAAPVRGAAPATAESPGPGN